MDRLLDPALPDPEFVALLEQPLQFLYTSPSTQEVRSSNALLPVCASFAPTSRPSTWVLLVFAGCSYVHTAGVPCVNVSAIA